MYIHVHTTQSHVMGSVYIVISLVPRPHPLKRKGSGDIGAILGHAHQHYIISIALANFRSQNSLSVKSELFITKDVSYLA